MHKLVKSIDISKDDFMYGQQIRIVLNTNPPVYLQMFVPHETYGKLGVEYIKSSISKVIKEWVLNQIEQDLDEILVDKFKEPEPVPPEPLTEADFNKTIKDLLQKDLKDTNYSKSELFKYAYGQQPGHYEVPQSVFDEINQDVLNQINSGIKYAQGKTFPGGSPLIPTEEEKQKAIADLKANGLFPSSDTQQLYNESKDLLNQFNHKVDQTPSEKKKKDWEKWQQEVYEKYLLNKKNKGEKYSSKYLGSKYGKVYLGPANNPPAPSPTHHTVSPYTPSGFTGDVVHALENAIPGFTKMKSKYPCNCDKSQVYVNHNKQDTLPNIIVHLNDHCKWTREDIADWLETLDHDLSFKV